MAHRRKIYFLNSVRAIVALALIVIWSLAALTGFLLEFSPKGQGAGQFPLFLGLSRHEWGDTHFMICVIALFVTVVHVLLDWRVLRGYLRFLFNSHPNKR